MRKTLLGLLVTTTVLTGVPQAHAETAPAPVAAGWLARQLVNGDHLETVVGPDVYPDQGLTADAVLAFDAAGVAQSSAAKATTWLSGKEILRGYLGDGTGESYAGAHAKVALVAQAQGLDPRAFGGVDVLKELGALLEESGRFSDKSSFGDFSNGITQSLAIIALHRAGDVPASAVKFQVEAQCPDGGFPLDFGKPTCASDVDTTGFVVQALLAAGETEAAGKALDWLAKVQQPSGAFKGSGPTDVENSNSTGLAATALRVGKRDKAADKAVDYLKARQVGCDGAEPGAIAYDATGFSKTNAARATAQGVVGLVGVSLADITNKGAKADAPALECAAPTTTTTPVPTTSAVAAPPTGPELAATGPDQAVPLTLAGVLAILTGSALLMLFRRRVRA